MLVDSHCHLDRIDLAPFGGHFDQFLTHAKAEGVGHILCVSIDLESYPAMLDQVADYPNISVSVGVHPNDKDRQEPTPEMLVELASHSKNVAIGETGLDYFRSEGDLTWQQDRFRRHIQAAHLAKKPLIIHTRAAQEDTITILQDEQARDVGGVMHCFTENWEMAKQALDLGFYISFSGIITFNSAEELREVVKKVPNDRILIETDAPYLAPVPHRGRSNIPQYVAHVADCVAELKGATREAIADLTRDNYQRLFGPLIA